MCGSVVGLRPLLWRGGESPRRVSTWCSAVCIHRLTTLLTDSSHTDTTRILERSLPTLSGGVKSPHNSRGACAGTCATVCDRTSSCIHSLSTFNPLVMLAPRPPHNAVWLLTMALYRCATTHDRFDLPRCCSLRCGTDICLLAMVTTRGVDPFLSTR